MQVLYTQALWLHFRIVHSNDMNRPHCTIWCIHFENGTCLLQGFYYCDQRVTITTYSMFCSFSTHSEMFPDWIRAEGIFCIFFQPMFFFFCTGIKNPSYRCILCLFFYAAVDKSKGPFRQLHPGLQFCSALSSIKWWLLGAVNVSARCSLGM